MAQKIRNIVVCMAGVAMLLLTASTVSAQGRLILNGGKVTLANGATVVIDNPASNAITRTTSGHIISEGENNIVQWNMRTTAGTYTIPWGYGSSNYIPLTFTKTAGTGNGGFKFSTYHTTTNNSIRPSGVTNLNGSTGADISSFAVDRFWQINATGYTTKPTLNNIIMSYVGSEYDAPNEVSLESKLTAQRWNAATASWVGYVSGGVVNATANTVTIPSISATNLQPWWMVAYPGSNMHWVAASNSVWSNAANWSTAAGGTGGAGVPTAADAVYFESNKVTNCTIDMNATMYSLNIQTGYTGTISQGANPVSVGSAATFGDGIFQGGSADVTVNGPFAITGAKFTAPASTLDLKNNFSLTAGTFTHNNGTLKLSGTSGKQTITSSSVNTFNNITVTNTSAATGASIESSQNLAGVLTLGNNVVFDADGSANTAILTLLSTGDSPTRDAAIGILPAGAQVSGNVTVQRYMAIEGPGKGRIYRYIASPLQAATVVDIQKEISITGTFTGTSKCSGCTTAASMFSYNEKILTDLNKNGIADADDGYEGFPIASNTEVLTPGKGYAMFVRGNLMTTALWDVRGQINAGNITPVTFPLTFTSSGKIDNDGWNLVGNPFPSTIDWDAAKGWTKTNVDAAIYIRDNGLTNTQIAAWNGVTGTNGGSSRIAMGQGFWVKANGNGTPVLKADENVKAAGTQTTFYRKATPENLLRITLANTTTRDEAVVHFRDDASEKFDSHADALKLANATFNLSSLMADGQALAINSLPALGCNNSIKLNVTDIAAGNYTLNFSEYETFPAALQISLTDNFTNSTINVRDTKSYSFAVTSQAASYGNNRFTVNFGWPAVQSDFAVTAQNICAGSDAIVQISNSQSYIAYTAQVKNSSIASVPVTGNGNSIQVKVPNAGLTSGVDTLVVTAALNSCSQSVVKTVAIRVEKPAAVFVQNGKLCNSGAVTLNASGAPANGAYRWYESAQATTPIADQKEKSYTTPVLQQTKTYYVAGVSAMGCEGTRQAVVAEIVAPKNVTIEVKGDSLVSNYASGNQWYLNQSMLTGATSQAIAATKSGIYTVEATFNGCTTTAAREMIIAGNEHEAISVSVYPNPVVNELHIEVPASGYNLNTFRLINAAGQPVGTIELQREGNNWIGSFDMKRYPSGVYIVQSTDAASVVEVKVVKN
jgi:hypothetical protein